MPPKKGIGFDKTAEPCYAEKNSGKDEQRMFLNDYSAFLGDGSRNRKGQDLGEFLQGYDPHRYDTPSVTTDIIVLQVEKGAASCRENGRVLLIRRGNHPCINAWALPGGFVDMKENLKDGALRELQEETGVSGVPMEAVGVWGDWKRDPRTRVITLPHLAILEEEVSVQAGDDAGDARWFTLSFEKGREEMYPDGWLRETYGITLSSGDVTLTPVVARLSRPEDVLIQEEFLVEDTGSMAADHSGILLQALLHAERALSRRAHG